MPGMIYNKATSQPFIPWLSTKSKPTAGVHAGSILIEMDTSSIYMYDADGQTWLPFMPGGSGGSGGTPTLESLSVSENGNYMPSSGVDGFSEVAVDVHPNLENISISENGTYTSDDYDGFGTVTVNVSGSATPSVISIDTIRGTVGDPWGELSIEDIVRDINDFSAYAYITVVSTGDVYYYSGVNDDNVVVFSHYNQVYPEPDEFYFGVLAYGIYDTGMEIFRVLDIDDEGGTFPSAVTGSATMISESEECVLTIVRYLVNDEILPAENYTFGGNE